MARHRGDATGIIMLVLGVTTLSFAAQDEEMNPWSAGADLISSFVWRGARQGSGPYIQLAV
jgi:hypothetical protein